MSIYSGKCDCFDVLVKIYQCTEEELKNDVKLYVGNSTEPLKIESYKTIIPYYPNLVIFSHYDKAGKRAIIRISSDSFVDQEERKRLEYYLEQLLKIRRRCMRKKIEFNIDDVVEEVFWIANKEEITELAKRVKANNGKNIDFSDIHLKIYESYRRKLVYEMIKNGLNPADYGYERFVKDGDNIENFKK